MATRRSRSRQAKPRAAGAARVSATARPAPGATRPQKKPGKSIIDQKQTPWGWILTVAVIVLFAGAVVGVVIATRKGEPTANAGCTAVIGSKSTAYINELKCAADIRGVTFKPEPDRNHATGVLEYDATPPIGGNHSQVWADCSGTVYAEPIANENALHSLEHGGLWITYRPDLDASAQQTLAALVSGRDRMFVSPYPRLTAPISLQYWGYQLKVNSANDPRIDRFITVLRGNPKVTPEPGATCSNSAFIEHPSSPGHPLEA